MAKNKVNRAIHIFPKFSNEKIIEIYRKKYDPLYGLIKPHITLVFPFESKLTSLVVEKHVKDALIGIKPFNIKLHGFSKSFDGYIFLNIVDGFETIINLHNKLYSGILSTYRDKSLEYKPHITVGKFENKEELNSVLVELSLINICFYDYVTSIFTEIIDEKGNSIIESAYKI